MSSENKANYARIGFTLVLGIAAAIGTLVYVGGAAKENKMFIAETYCDSGVSGLSVGSEVNFRGVQVGSVKEITFVGREYDVAENVDGSKILIRMALDEPKMKTRRDYSGEESLRRFINNGLRATVTSSGITGLSKIELNYPKTEVEAPQMTWLPEYICIPPAPSILDSFSASASRLLAELNKMDFQVAWSNINKFANSAAQFADNANEIVDSQKAALGAILNEADSAIANFRELLEEIRGNPSLLIRQRDSEPLEETR